MKKKKCPYLKYIKLITCLLERDVFPVQDQAFQPTNVDRLINLHILQRWGCAPKLMWSLNK